MMSSVSLDGKKIRKGVTVWRTDNYYGVISGKVLGKDVLGYSDFFIVMWETSNQEERAHPINLFGDKQNAILEKLEQIEHEIKYMDRLLKLRDKLKELQ